MKFAYADPPYLGNGVRRYAPFHDNAQQYDQPQAHIDLCSRLIAEYPDGFAISCNPKDLSMYLSALPPSVRVAAWCKSFHQIRVNVSTQYSWEPVIWFAGRNIVPRKPMVRDHLITPIAMKKGLPGAKPQKFNLWVLELLGFDYTQDELDDLFPGSGGMGQAITKLRLQPSLFDSTPCEIIGN